MGSIVRWVVSAVVLSLVVLVFHSGGAMADDTPTTEPSTQPAGSVKITVTGVDGKPVEGANVTVRPAGAKKAQGASADAQATGGSKGTIVGRGKTDTNGVLTLDDIPAGDYSVMARTATERGRIKTTIQSGQTAEVAIQMAPGTGKPGGKKNKGGDTTQPAN
jgi:hypothetical protein